MKYLKTAFPIRFNFVAYVVFSAVNTVVYCVPAGWLWGSHGFLYKLGVVDIAGSCGVHLCGGASGEPTKPSLLLLLSYIMVISLSTANISRAEHDFIYQADIS